MGHFSSFFSCHFSSCVSHPQFAHPPSAEMKAVALAALHDRMTEQHFPHPIQSFLPESIPAPLSGPIDILGEGRSALEKANQELGQWGPWEKSRRSRRVLGPAMGRPET